MSLIHGAISSFIFISAFLVSQVVSNTIIRFNDGEAIYEFDRADCLGVGHFGRVFNGTRKEGNITELVAFKVMAKLDVISRREINVYETLGSHESIPKYYGYFQHLNEAGVVYGLELLGNTLKSLLTKYRCFSTPTIMRVGIQILDALEYIHGKGVTHHDIHLGNIAIGFKNPSKIHIFDFGMSKINSDEDEKLDDLRFLADTLSVMSDGLPCIGKHYDHKSAEDRQKVLNTFINKAVVGKANFEELRRILRAELEKYQNQPNYEKFEWELAPSDNDVDDRFAFLYNF